MSSENKEGKISNLTDIQKQIFEKITKNEFGDIKTLLIGYKDESVDFFDENGMTPLLVRIERLMISKY